MPRKDAFDSLHARSSAMNRLVGGPQCTKRDKLPSREQIIGASLHLEILLRQLAEEEKDEERKKVLIEDIAAIGKLRRHHSRV